MVVGYIGVVVVEMERDKEEYYLLLAVEFGAGIDARSELGVGMRRRDK